MDNNNPEPEPMDTEMSDSNSPQDHVNKNTEEERRKKPIKRKLEERKKQIIMASGHGFIKVFTKLLVETNAEREEMFLYLQRVFHAIFFFGHINHPPIEPKDFIPARSWDSYQNCFPKAFEQYRTHLPPQTPYSILLEYITKVYDGDLNSILEELQKTNDALLDNFSDDQRNQLKPKEFALSASVITYSRVNDPYNNNDLTTAYGASIAYRERVPRRLMIAISTLYVWDKVISYEVMCKGCGHGIHFPNTVCCKAFKFNTTIHEYEPTPPCTNCHEDYKVNFDPKYVIPTKKTSWPHGNCAETESLSNLLRFNENIRNAVYTTDGNGETLSRPTIITRFRDEHEGRLKNELKNLLGARDFKVTQNDCSLFSPADCAPHESQSVMLTPTSIIN